MNLSKLDKHKGKMSPKKRLGRGYGSTKGGHTVGYGTKGQKARGRGKVPIGFEGGQVPLYKKVPKIPRFKSSPRKDVTSVSLVKLNNFKDGDKVNPQALVKNKVITDIPKNGIKIIANGNLHKKLSLENFRYSKKSLELIEKSGSTVLD